MMENKKRNLFVALAGIFVTNAVLAEIIGVKIFSFEKSFGLMPVQLNIVGDYVLDLNLTAGVMIWPVVFITTDIINEYFGEKGVRRISILTAVLISYCFIAIRLTMWLAPADFWVTVNDVDGKGFNINYAFIRIFGQGISIIVGSLIAFLIGQLLDAFVFAKLKRFTGQKMIWLRATGSTLISQFVDSYVVIYIAFYLLAQEELKWPIAQVIAVGTNNYLYKFGVAILLTPLVYLGHFLIDKYLGKELAQQLKDEAINQAR